MPSSAIEKHDCHKITDQTIHDLKAIDCHELILENITDLDVESIRWLRQLTKPQSVTFPNIKDLSPTVALELADGFRTQLNFPGIQNLPRNTLRALCSWKRGWITFANIQTCDVDDEHFELALHSGNLSLVRMFIEFFDFRVNHVFRNRSVPILIAGQHLNGALIRLLIDLGADPNVQSHKDGDTILHMLCRARANGLITFLIDQVDLTLKNVNGRTPQDEYMDPDPIRERLTPPEPPASY